VSCVSGFLSIAGFGLTRQSSSRTYSARSSEWINSVAIAEDGIIYTLENTGKMTKDLVKITGLNLDPNGDE
jgi:hypothetical protein